MSLRSDVSPRVRIAPPFVSNDVDDAVFLASAYALTPDPWQAEVLESWLGRQSNGKWSASRCGLAVARQNGKNAIIEMRELFGMVALGEKFLHTAHEVKTARKAFLRIVSFFENERQYPELAALVKDIRKTNGQEAVLLTNGGGVEFVARSKGSARGFTCDVLVLDEAQDLKDEELEALKPTISAPPLRNPQTIFTGTPPDPEKDHLGSGEVFARVRRGADKAARTAWTDFGVEDGPLPDVDDRATWHVTNPALGHRLHIDGLIDEREDMSPEGFARERLGWWGNPDGTGHVFGAGKWEAGFNAKAKFPKRGLFIGLAVSLNRDWSSIGTAAPTKRDKVIVGATDRRPGTEWLVERAAEIQKKHRCGVVLDGRGPAATLLPELERAGVDVLVANTTDVLDACAGLFDRVQQGRLVHQNNPELNASIRGAQKRPVNDRWAWGRKLSAGDVSMLEAVTLAAWAADVETEADPTAYFI